MKIKRILYPVTSLGPGNRVGIWTTGCKHACPGCISKDLWDVNAGIEINVEDIILKIKKISDFKTNKITISGGEPFLQNELYDLLLELKKNGFTDILLYTGFTIEELIEKIPNISDYFSLIDILIEGRYIEKLNDNRPLRGSSNQRIFIFNKNLQNEYEDILLKERTYQVIYNDIDEMEIIGIVPKGFIKNINKYLKNKNMQIKVSEYGKKY